MPAAGFDSEEDDAVILHGTLVCLRDEGGALVVAKGNDAAEKGGADGGSLPA